MRRILLVLAALAAQAALGETRPVPSGPDLGSLSARVSESACVVRGRVLALKAVSRTDLPPPVQVGPNLWRGAVIGSRESAGILSTVAVEQVLCRKEDLVIAPPTAAPSPGVVQVFVPAGDPLSAVSRFDPTRHNRQEFLLPNREYLLFLYEPPGQDMLVKTYRLEPGLTYYRTVEGERGAVALPDAANPEKPREFITPLVRAVTVFCEAVKGPDAATKIRQLQGVRDFLNYPAWRQSVDEAVQALTGAPGGPPRQR